MSSHHRRSYFALAFLLACLASFSSLHAESEFASAHAPTTLPKARAPAGTAMDEAEIKKLIDQALTGRDAKAKEEATAARKVTGTWKNGITFETGDKNFRFNIGGVNQFDMGFYGAGNDVKRSIGKFNNMVDPGQTLQDGMDFRRARLRISGLAYEQIEFFAQYEFANAIDLRQRSLGIPNSAGVANPALNNFDPAEGPLFNEVYIGLVKLPVVGNIRVGRHRESLNFVTATADNNQLWMERGVMFDAFNSNYNFSQGITVSRTYMNDRAYTLFGVFMQNNSSGRLYSSVGDGTYAYDGRITCLPLWDEEEQLWLHLGVDYSYRNLYQNSVRYRVRPDVRVGTSFQVPSIIDTGTIFSRDAQQIANLEFASAWGPWTFAAEGTISTVTNAYSAGLPRPDGKLPEGVESRGIYQSAGGYVELLRFLTSDHHGYIKDRPGYARVTPTRRFVMLEKEDETWSFDTGAWEVGLRYDYVDLTHGGINGGTAQGITGAINWYLASNARVQINASWMTREFKPGDREGRVNGEFTALGIRFNCDF